MQSHLENSITSVPVKNINLEDRFYSISPYPFNEGKLINSIKMAGITTPVVLEPIADNCFRIASGFRRVSAAVQAELDQIPSLIATRENRLELFWRTVQENYGSRELHELETAEIIQKLIDLHGVEEESLLSVHLPAIGLRGSRQEMDRFLALAGLNPRLKQACLFGNLLCATALEIRNWPEEEQAFLTSLSSRLMLGTNKQKQIVRLIEDLKKKTRTGLRSIWAASGLQEIAPDELNFDKIHSRLTGMRYPVLTEHLDHFNKLKATLFPGREIKLQAPRYFDGDKFTVTFTAASPGEFRNKARQLLEVSESSELEDMYTLL